MSRAAGFTRTAALTAGSSSRLLRTTRIRLLTRFLSTADPTAFETMIANWLASPGRKCRVALGLPILFPAETTSRISLLERKRFSRGNKGYLRAELCAPLATASGHDGTSGAGAHAGAEAVVLCTTAVVGLKCALAHFGNS